MLEKLYSSSSPMLIRGETGVRLKLAQSSPDFFPSHFERSDSAVSLQQWLTPEDRRNQYIKVYVCCVDRTRKGASRQ